MEQNGWKIEKIRKIYQKPLFLLISEAHRIHVQHHDAGEVQVCKLINFKTGGCTEDCKYCSQSRSYPTSVVPLPLKQYEEMLDEARQAVQAGASRVCLSAAWREVREGKAFETILKTVKGIEELGVEVCCTLGMVTKEQLERLRAAGLYAYNHNLDSSRRFYETIITTRSYDERLATLDRVERAKVSVCCGGILGMGESQEDRIELIHTLASRMPPPESVPINTLIAIKGTPLEKQPPLPIWELLRVIATCRIAMPQAMLRLCGGRYKRTVEEQALCFFAGANSIFSGDKLLTTPIYSFSDDNEMFTTLGLSKRTPFKKRNQKAHH